MSRSPDRSLETEGAETVTPNERDAVSTVGWPAAAISEATGISISVPETTRTSFPATFPAENRQVVSKKTKKAILRVF